MKSAYFVKKKPSELKISAMKTEIVSEKIASGQQKFLIGSHEQYAYTHYRSYIPEYFAGVDAVCRILTENGYKPVYYSEVIQ